MIPLNDGTDWSPDKEQLLAWQQAYPGVNVPQELLRIGAWSNANPKNRKTPKGVERFVNTWLSKAQDESSTVRAARSDSKPDARVQQIGMSPDEFRHAVALDKIITAKLLGVPELGVEGTFKFNLHRLAEAIVEGERKEFEAGNYSNERAMRSAIYGTAHATLRQHWR